MNKPGESERENARGKNSENTRGNVYESKSELFGESGQVRRYVDVQLRMTSGDWLCVRQIVHHSIHGRGKPFSSPLDPEISTFE